MSFFNIPKGLQGGVNDTTEFPRWLDAHLFDGATFKDLNNGGGRGLDQRLRHLQPHAVSVLAGHVQRAVQRSAELSGLAGGRGVRGGAGRLYSDRDQEFPGRLPGRAAGLGAARAQ